MQLDQSWLVAQGEDARLIGLIHAECRSAVVEGGIAVAVSGGGDSMALLHVMSRWAHKVGVQLWAVTVDHGLRDEAVAEAEAVADFCDDIWVAHETLRWTTWDGHGNVQAQARTARYKLMADWAAENGIETIILGHTLDDVAETFVMRLARKAGIDGLALMDRVFSRHGLVWHRPLLTVQRNQLRDYLKRNAVAWIDDPSNENVDFERIRVRKALAHLAELGVTLPVLHHSGMAVRQARDALEHYARAEAERYISTHDGDLVLADVAHLPVEMKRRLFAKAIGWVGGLGYPPRATTLQHLNEGLVLSGTAPAAGCLVVKEGTALRIMREPNAVRMTVCKTDEIWDGRWSLSGPHADDLRVRALGEGIASCPDWRETGLPRASLMASPAIWRGDVLVSAPIAGYSQGWAARIVADFHSSLVAH